MSRKFVTRVVAVWCAVGLLLLSACGGGDEPSRTLDLDGESTESTGPEMGNELSEEAPDEPREGELTRAASAASTPEEKEVAEVWFTYLEEFVRVLGVPDPLGLKLSTLAGGTVLSGVLRYAGELADKDLRLGGGMVATLLEVEVADRSAVIHGCFHNSMIEVDAMDKPVEKLEPWFASKYTLTKSGDQWSVVDAEMEAVPKCV